MKKITSEQFEKLDKLGRRIKILGLNIKVSREELDKLKMEVFKDFLANFFDRDEIGMSIEQKESDWKWKIETELSFLLRSMIGSKNKLVRIREKYFDSDLNYSGKNDLFITRKYGLKEPNVLRPRFLFNSFQKDDAGNPEIFYFKDGKLEGKLNEKQRRVIDFSVLIGKKGISKIKLEKFFKFMPRVLLIERQWKKLLFRNSKGLNELRKILEFDEYGTAEEFEKLPERIKKIEPFRIAFLKKQDLLVEKADKIVNEVKEYNKPYRIVMKLDGSE